MVYVITVTCMYSLQPPSEHLSRFGGKGDVIGGNDLSKIKKKEQQNLFGSEKGRLFEFLSNQHSSSRVLPLLYNPRQVTILPFSAFSEKSHVIALAGFHIFQFSCRFTCSHFVCMNKRWLNSIILKITGKLFCFIYIHNNIHWF